MPPKKDEPREGVDWGEFTEEKTRSDEHAPIPEEAIDTGPHDVTKLPGYDVGYAAGYAAGARRREDEVLAGFRLVQIQYKTDPGVAHLLEERMRRWLADPQNMELVTEVLKP